MHVTSPIKTILAAITLSSLVMIRDTSAAEVDGSVSGQVEIKRGWRYKKDRSNVVVYLQGVPNSEPKPLEGGVSMDQTDKQFDPRMMVIPVGTTVDFPNNDRVFHNVFSVSRPAQFDLGLYKSGSSKSVTFRRPGVVDVFCNIHPDMAAKLLVLDTTYYTLTAPDGSFSLEGVPPGTYSLVAWQSKGEAFTAEVTVEPGGETKVDVELREDRWSRDRHTRKDGTPYGRYK